MAVEGVYLFLLVEISEPALFNLPDCQHISHDEYVLILPVFEFCDNGK